MPIETDAVLAEQQSASRKKSLPGRSSADQSSVRVLANDINGRWTTAQASGRVDVTNLASGENSSQGATVGRSEVETQLRRPQPFFSFPPHVCDFSWGRFRYSPKTSGPECDL